jgi:hypothetical protein
MTIDTRVEPLVRAESSRRRGLLPRGLRAILAPAREVLEGVVRQHDRSAPKARHLLAERLFATRAPRAPLPVGQRSVIGGVTVGTGDIRHVSESRHHTPSVQPQDVRCGIARADGERGRAESPRGGGKERDR